MHTYCTVFTLSWKKKSPFTKIIMPLTNRELFAKARLSDFKPDASLVSSSSLFLEQSYSYFCRRRRRRHCRRRCC